MNWIRQSKHFRSTNKTSSRRKRFVHHKLLSWYYHRPFICISFPVLISLIHVAIQIRGKKYFFTAYAHFIVSSSIFLLILKISSDDYVRNGIMWFSQCLQLRVLCLIFINLSCLLFSILSWRWSQQFLFRISQTHIRAISNSFTSYDQFIHRFYRLRALPLLPPLSHLLLQQFLLPPVQ